MTFQDVINYFRAESMSEQEKGSNFEKLIKKWLQTDTRYSSLLTDIWLWNEFPAKDDFGGKDLGIDLVARTDFGGYWAIQCKCYAEDAVIDKNAVDSFLATSSRLFTDPMTGQEHTAFVARVWISTTEKWNSNAEESIKNQHIPVTRIGLETFEESLVDWEALLYGKEQESLVKTLLPHQEEALKEGHAHYTEHDRGKLIMACGTGKTFTSLALVEQEIRSMRGNESTEASVSETIVRGRVLFMVPSIALLGQALNAWMADATLPMKAICICSDPKSAQKQGGDSLNNSIIDLALPATTNSKIIAQRFAHYRDHDGLLVVFSTYQSIEAVSEAQKAIMEQYGDEGIFDFIVCDEAHRTTGIKIAGMDESAFTKIHDNNIIQGKKRLYMTATPRLYGDSAKVRAKENDHVLCSMDDVKLYGEEFYRVGFSYAVTHGLLTDYKVLVLTVGSESDLPAEIKEQVRDNDCKELDFDMASRLIGCINGLSKHIMGDNDVTWETDPGIMRRALAFCPNINKAGDTSSSMNTARQLPKISQEYWDSLPEERRQRTVRIEAEHIDGSMNSRIRTEKLAWLKADSSDANTCRLISNVRCLSEGVDVPALDAVIFLSARNSQVDVVQSVGRVMRNFRKGKPNEKKYGYIIVPVVVPPHLPAEEALNDNERFRVVWSILNALRSHDDSFNAIVNKVALNKEKPSKIVVGTVPPLDDIDETYATAEEKRDATNLAPDLTKDAIARQLSLFEGMQGAIYARMVEKVGDRLYWEKWANDVGTVAHNFIARITELVETPGTHQDAFHEFVKALRSNINEAISHAQAIEMLAQHLITRPVFDALFSDYHFAQNNTVCRSMERMIEVLVDAGLEKDTAVLNKFYDSVRMNVGNIDNLEGKQTVIKNLYEKFFKGAFPKTVDQLGIVYTPVECVDFILRSVNDILQNEFDCTLSDENVHILDPFTGTGTFITRLLQSGLIKPEDMERKYRHEIHCNEMVLLAYYVADVNIESVFHDITKREEYLKFDNICLTDTFELTAERQMLLYSPFKDNSESIARQKKLPIKVIMGNPPYSAGQRSANDNAQNLKYPTLDARIERTYVSRVKVTNKNSLYDSYIRAFRWASDRLQQGKEGGVIGFITNGGWLDGNAAAGFRKCLEEEFSSIYVFHLRGDQRTSGELSRREGGKIFGAGSRAPVVITLLVYNPEHKGKAKIHYCDIGDYLKRDDKLHLVTKYRSVLSRSMPWAVLEPNEHGDWLNQRSALFESYVAIGDKKGKSKQVFFEPYYSRGVATGRDVWCYNSSHAVLEANVSRSIEFYNLQCENTETVHDIAYDATQFSWTTACVEGVLRKRKLLFSKENIRTAIYRPFVKQNLYFTRDLNERVYQMPQLFPMPQHKNMLICISGLGGKNPLSSFIVDIIPDLNLLDAGTQCFPLYYYTQRNVQQLSFLTDNMEAYERKDGITDWILKNIRSRFGNSRSITKEHVFYYVYGILHSKDYRNRFNADLKKSLPRIPIVDDIETFMVFSVKGKELAELHLNYENIPTYQGLKITGTDTVNFTVEKMCFAKIAKEVDKTTILYNNHIKIENIPLKAYDYIVNGRSAIEWIMERYQVKTDKDSGITNNPNHWAEEQGNLRYILDLLCRVVNVSVQTVAIVEGLPRLEFGE